MNKILTETIISCALILSAISSAQGAEVGTTAPFFEVKSGDNKHLTPDMLKGKIVVIFYETKDNVRKNLKLKNDLDDFFAQQPGFPQETVFKLPIINCSSAFWPIDGIWKGNLRKNSKKIGMTIYGDWNGKMLSDYNFKDNESNFLIIDQQGIIRYYSYGKIDEKETREITKLLNELEGARG